MYGPGDDVGRTNYSVFCISMRTGVTPRQYLVGVHVGLGACPKRTQCALERLVARVPPFVLLNLRFELCAIAAVTAAKTAGCAAWCAHIGSGRTRGISRRASYSAQTSARWPYSTQTSARWPSSAQTQDGDSRTAVVMQLLPHGLSLSHTATAGATLLVAGCRVLVGTWKAMEAVSEMSSS